MRYRVNWCFYASPDCDPLPFAQLVDDFPESYAINGHPNQVDPIVSLLQQFTVGELHTSYFCRLPVGSELAAANWPTRRATVDDIDALVDLYADAGILRRDADGLRRTLASGRIVVTIDGDNIVSSVATSIETTNAAMVGGVFTPEPLRNQGYASAAMTHLCAELLAEGKQPCLFYDNPAAGSIYRRLGFEDIGPWKLVLLERTGHTQSGE
jgi:predicted GNAT family acetyltransferase